MLRAASLRYQASRLVRSQMRAVLAAGVFAVRRYEAPNAGKVGKNAFAEAYSFSGVIGILVGIVSVANLIIRGFDIGVTPVLATLVDAYTWLFHDVIFGFLFGWLHVEVPSWVKDVFAAYLVAQGIWIRAFNHLLLLDGEGLWGFLFSQEHNDWPGYLFKASAMLWPLAPFIWISEGPFSYSSDVANPIWLQCGTVVGGVVIFLLMNAGLPPS